MLAAAAWLGAGGSSPRAAAGSSRPRAGGVAALAEHYFFLRLAKLFISGPSENLPGLATGGSLPAQLLGQSSVSASAAFDFGATSKII
jgi:hypothetical protein